MNCQDKSNFYKLNFNWLFELFYCQKNILDLEVAKYDFWYPSIFSGVASVTLTTPKLYHR